MPSRSNTRRETRFPVDGIQGSLHRPGDLRVINLSRSGIAFATFHRVTVGDSYFVEIRYRSQAVSVEIELRWCFRQPDTEPNEPSLYLAGGRLVDIVRDDPEGLWRGLLVIQG